MLEEAKKLVDPLLDINDPALQFLEAPDGLHGKYMVNTDAFRSTGRTYIHGKMERFPQQTSLQGKGPHVQQKHGRKILQSHKVRRHLGYEAFEGFV